MNFGVVVKHSYILKVDQEEVSCSGLYLGNGFVLSHSVIIEGIINSSSGTQLREALEKHGYCSLCEDDPSSSIFVQPQHSSYTVYTPSDLVYHMQKNYTKGTCLNNNEQDTDTPVLSTYVPLSDKSSYSKYQAKLCLVVLEKNFRNKLLKVFPQQEGWNTSEEDSSADMYDYLALSTFVILSLGEEPCTLQNLDTLKKSLGILNQLTITPTKGTSILIESTPFGNSSPEVFINSISNGIISNTCGKKSALMMTDAACVLGSEGAAVYCCLQDRVYLCGLVALPFCTKSGEWIGLTLLMSFKLIIKSLIDAFHLIDVSNNKSIANHNEERSIKLQYSSGKDAQISHTRNCNMPWTCYIPEIEKSVVRVYQGSNWGTGFVVNNSPGVIITCDHVLRNNVYQEVMIELYDGTKHVGSITHRRHTNHSNLPEEHQNLRRAKLWDIAVITTDNLSVPALNLAKEVPVQGEPVIIVGHGLFSRSQLKSASVVKGLISKVTYVPQSAMQSINGIAPIKHNLLSQDHEPEVPVILQTNCSVYSGCSGAPVIQADSEKGYTVIGIVVCSTRDNTNKTAFPNVNLSIPSIQIYESITQYIHTGDPTYLKGLTVMSPVVERLWSLTRIPSSKL